MARITIIGLGLIGGSLGMALRRARLGPEIVGHDLRHEIANKARQRGAIDRAEWNLPAAVEKAKLVVIATPVGAIETIFRQVAPYLPEGGIVTDVGGTKEHVLRCADELLPNGVSFVGGHPMAGSELSGIDEASADLFAGCTYCLTPSAKASADAVETVAGIVSAIGAQPYFIEAAEHDSFVAAVSHLPFIAATALVNTAAKSYVWREMSRVAASGFRDTTRLASGDAVVHRDVCETNRESIMRWLDGYIVELADTRRAIEVGGASLEAIFTAAREARDKWLSGRVQEAPTPLEIPGPGEQLRQMLMGGLKPKERKK
ncbi:MAG: prephenate dehydrogenase/arogenate dehydrogenase family protein [Chloroflexi bacterium]|nr:prephenate dehydrogenase/arogenate dehydrogenase family protein [Chloroflexota bacterium]